LVETDGLGDVAAEAMMEGLSVLEGQSTVLSDCPGDSESEEGLWRIHLITVNGKIRILAIEKF
jgi:hypothetical protein